MPAPGDQHVNYGGKPIVNPFEEVKPTISTYTASEIATLQSRLEKQLGPEYLSSRPGGSGQKVWYITGEKCIQLANEVFGFNGWSSQIMTLQVDFMDEHPTTLKVSLGLSVIVRVTLRDGTFHEDIGYGHIENCKGKAAAFEKAKKEATTDALKRALRNFGNVLGNCIYDKEYLTKVAKLKLPPTKWDVDGLYRHADFAPVKKEAGTEQETTLLEPTLPRLHNTESLDDEFGDFDDADFSVPSDPDGHPDEVILPVQASSHHFGNGPAPARPPMPTSRSMAAPARPQEGPAVLTRAQSARGPPQNNPPKTPNAGLPRANNVVGPGPVLNRASEANAHLVRVQTADGGRVLNQPSRASAGSGPSSPSRAFRSSNAATDEDDLLAIPAGPPAVGFFSARVADKLPPGENIQPPAAVNLPTFNPHAESPSIRRTPGIDHKSSKPIVRPDKQVPGSTQSGLPCPNIVNPQLEATRRIGAPNSPSPMANRGSYKPPTMKRPSDAAVPGRAPLVDTPGNVVVGVDLGGDLKRQRITGA